MFLTSARNWQEMESEAAGCRPLPINKGDEYALVTKMYASSIKAAYLSCPISLMIATANTSEGIVLATTFSVADDPGAPLMLSSVLRHEDEQLAIKNILRTGRSLIIFFDELSRPVGYATCNLGQPEREAALTLVDTAGAFYVGPWTNTLSNVLDEVQAHSDPQLKPPAKFTPSFVTVPVDLSDFKTTNISAVGSKDVLEFRLDDPDEGRGLEQSTWQLLENLFEKQIYHSPQVVESNVNKRELTDILTYCDVGFCLFESKAASMLTTSLERTTKRRIKNVQKQIDKGIDQLVGAIKNLKGGHPLRTKDGTPIVIPSSVGNLHNGIIMVSEMLPGMDWKAIGDQLLAASLQANVMLHVLDLRELRMLVGVSDNNPVLFVAYLSHRFDILTKQKNAMIRTKLDGPPLP